MWEIVIHDAKGQICARGRLESGSLSIGRSPDNDLVIKDAAMSRRHARIELRDGLPWIQDMGSVNGVLIDEVKISEARPVYESSRVEISGMQLKVTPSQAPPADPESEASADHASAAPAGEGPAEPAPARETAEDTAARLLEQKISSIRSHRQQQSDARTAKRREFDAEWAKVLDELRKLRTRLRDEERLRYFSISRDGDSVGLKIDRSSGQTSLLMTRGHPDRPVGGEERIYVRDHVWPDKSFADPRDALNELLTHLASLLA